MCKLFNVVCKKNFPACIWINFLERNPFRVRIPIVQIKSTSAETQQLGNVTLHQGVVVVVPLRLGLQSWGSPAVSWPRPHCRLQVVDPHVADMTLPCAMTDCACMCLWTITVIAAPPANYLLMGIESPKNKVQGKPDRLKALGSERGASRCGFESLTSIYIIGFLWSFRFKVQSTPTIWYNF